jgi:hypothetical protein
MSISVMNRVILFALSLSVIFQAVAEAQQTRVAPIGETFVYELRTDYWYPTLSSSLRADGGAFKGTDINVVRDLGFDDKKPLAFAEFALKFNDKHKVRLDYMNFTYSGDKVAGSVITFNGVEYPLNARLRTDFQLRSIKAGYEYTFLRYPEGYLAFRIAADNLSAKASVEAMGAISNSASASVTAPVIGLSGRFFAAPWVSLTADLCGVGYDKSTVYDAALYLDINPIKNFGLTFGWRTMRININVDNTVSDTQWSGAFAGLLFRL